MKNNSVANSPAGHRHKNGYVIVEICGTSYAVHRIIWTLHNGDFDSGLVVDHIDGNKHNNSISNLRIVTHKENARNKLLNIPDSGYRQIRKTQDGKCYGVRWTEDSGRKYKQFRIKDYETENDTTGGIFPDQGNGTSQPLHFQATLKQDGNIAIEPGEFKATSTFQVTYP